MRIFSLMAALAVSFAAAPALAQDEPGHAEPTVPPPTIDSDGDGRMDAWDRDGDGRADAWDTDGDGMPDALDENGDGAPDTPEEDMGVES